MQDVKMTQLKSLWTKNVFEKEHTHTCMLLPTASHWIQCHGLQCLFESDLTVNPQSSSILRENKKKKTESHNDRAVSLNWERYLPSVFPGMAAASWQRKRPLQVLRRTITGGSRSFLYFL